MWAGALRRIAWRVFRPHTRGVKVMLFDRDGRLLLVRHTYVDTDLFALPGGGIARGEEAMDAARREVAEEVGCEVTALALLSVHHSSAEGKRDTISLFTGRTDDPPVADGFEIGEARFFALDALPGNVSPATLRRIAEYRGARVPDGGW